MKWTVLISIILCSAAFITSLSFLAVSCFNLASTENLFPLPGIVEWRRYLVHTIVISIAIMILSVGSCWGATRRNGLIAISILICHIAAFGVCIIYSNIIYNEEQNCQDDPFVIKNRTLEEFAKHRSSRSRDSRWLPDWLDSVQKHSSSCCGIVSYEDWREFWPEHMRQVPLSCCRSEDSCISDFDEMEWPKKPMDYIKNDEGCAAIMSKNASRRVQETLKFLIALIVLLACSILGFLLQFVLDFWTTAGKQSSDDSSKNSCFAWARVRFQRKYPSDQKPQDDPNGNMDNINLEQLAEVGSYSYTYLEQLKQQQSEIPQPEEENDSQVAMQQSFNPQLNQPNSYPLPQVASSAVPPQVSPQTYTYEVLPDNTNMYLNQPGLGSSSQSLPDDQQPNSVQERDADGAPTGQRIPMIYPDDTEKQNLKQLLRFGRRHRRHRKTELDADRPQ